MQPISLFDNQRSTLDDAIELSLASLNEYGRRYRHWALTYSGGKDSTSTTTFVAWAIKTGHVQAPETLTILYADTRQEYPPLHATAMELLARLKIDGFNPVIVLPEMDRRFYVYMFGRGVPPPHNQFRWCTGNLKIAPMTAALEAIRAESKEKFLLINGVRLGESDARDQRIALSCSKDSGECGQGWFEVKPPASAGDTLAPLLHWRLCHVYDWLTYPQRHGYPQSLEVALIYGGEDVRTGCIGCNLINTDPALENIVKMPAWTHLAPLLELKGIFRELQKPHNRLRKAEPERTADGGWASNGQRMGPLHMEARVWGLQQVLDIQQRAGVDLINAEEEARIHELIAANTWPDKWTGEEVRADMPLDRLIPVNGGQDLAIQPLLVR